MLYLTRKSGQSVMLNENVDTFPSDVTVLRREIYDRIQDENKAAAQASPDLFETLDPNPK
jgi:carbon storage regulator